MHMSHILETPGGCVYPYVICDKTNSKSKCFLKKKKKSQHCFFQVKVLVSWLEHYFSLFKKKKKEQQRQKPLLFSFRELVTKENHRIEYLTLAGGSLLFLPRHRRQETV